MISTVNKAAVGLLILAFFPAIAFADDDAERARIAAEMEKYRFQTVTTKEGFKFSIPSDMPIETRNGIVAPIPFEEYLYFKFRKIEERMGDVEKRIGEMEKKILAKFDELEKRLDATLNAAINNTNTQPRVP